MPSEMAEVSVDTLQAFAEAWNRHDVDALMSFMRKDDLVRKKVVPQSIYDEIKDRIIAKQ